MPDLDPAAGKPPSRQPIATARAWARFRRIMAWMTGVGVLCSALALAWLRWSLGSLHLHMAIATVLGVFFTVLVGTGLMTLSFLSSGSGHDAEAGRRPER